MDGELPTVCEACFSPMRFFQYNLEGAILMCPNLDCVWPLETVDIETLCVPVTDPRFMSQRIKEAEEARAAAADAGEGSATDSAGVPGADSSAAVPDVPEAGTSMPQPPGNLFSIAGMRSMLYQDPASSSKAEDGSGQHTLSSAAACSAANDDGSAPGVSRMFSTQSMQSLPPSTSLGPLAQSQEPPIMQAFDLPPSATDEGFFGGGSHAEADAAAEAERPEPG